MIHVVMTPVRNEAWVLRAFLEATSRWADYIIIADQMSTDGSREIALQYDKVVLIDNNNPEFNEPERQAMLITKAREIAAGRDTLLWGLDADEVLDASFQDTDDWRRIIHSVPGDVIWFKWAEICPDKKHYWLSPVTYYPWLFHDDGAEPHGNYVRNMHSMRIPYPIEEKQLHYVDDFRVLHLAYLNPNRTQAKRRFYSFVDWEMNHRSPVILSRSYAQTKRDDLVFELSDKMIHSQTYCDLDILSLVDTSETKFWFDDYVTTHLGKYSNKKTRKLPIWDKSLLKNYSLDDPRTILDKLVHFYLESTQRNNAIIRRGIDKLLKFFYK